MKNLNLTRIKYLWIAEITESWKRLLITAVSILGGMVLISWIGINLDHIGSNVQDYIGFCSMLYSVFLIIFISVGLSEIFHSMQSKEGRISFLSLPATPEEKFTANLIRSIIVPIIIFYVDLFLSDLIHLLILPIGKNVDPHLYKLLFMDFAGNIKFIGIKNYGITNIAESIVFNLFFYSLFLLGGCFWRKKAFLKTFSLLTIVFIIRGSILVNLSKAQIDTVFKDWIHMLGERTSSVLFSVLFGALTLCMWYYSYKLFRNAEVISQKRRWL